jgi:anaerobic magnesium-protoporphyrin IX monomethyl ester cyclase
MRIILIQPKKPFYGTTAESHWQLTRPFSLFFLASSLEKNTPYETEIIDLEQRKYRDVSYKEIFKNIKADIFGLTAATYTRFEAIRIAETLKSYFPGVPVIAGGPHFMYCAKDTLEKVPGIDIIVRGEGDLTIVELTRAIETGTELERVKGITFRANNRVVETPDRDIFKDLDSLPIYSGYSFETYPEFLFDFPGQIPATSVMTSRGCPYNCIFCAKAGMKYRVRSAEGVVDELVRLKETHKVEGINFLDLTFTANAAHVKAVCNAIINRGLNIKWWCESRVNIRLDLLELMKKSGCVSMVIGVESGSPATLRSISKDINPDQVLEFCKRCYRLGIFVTPYFTYSYPDETEADVRQTLAFMEKLEKYTSRCALQPTMIFPGTKLEKIAREKGILPRDFSWSEPYESDFNKELDQLSNVPLFIDKLKPGFLKEVKELRRQRIEYKMGLNYLSQLSTKDFLKKAFWAVRNMRKSLKYLFSPAFYRDFLMLKLKRKSSKRN